MTAPASASYPASLTLDPPDRIANWRPLVHWLLALPHYVVMYALGIVAEVCGVISWFAILFTGKDLEGLAGLRCLYLRYSMRTWAYMGFLVEGYPPFSFDTTGADPGDYERFRIDVAPQLEGRNRLTVLFRLLMVIPHAIVLGIAWIGGFVCVVIALFAVLFTGRWPSGLRDFVVGLMRWNLRVNAYMFLLVDDYPPFSTD
jgi:hypothetical protein